MPDNLKRMDTAAFIAAETDRLYDYDYRNLNKDFEDGKYAGCYGWDNSVYYGIAEHKAKVDLNDFHSKRTKDEFYLPEFKALIDHPGTQEHWKRIVTFNPHGLTSTPPTIAATNGTLNVPEIASKLVRDGTIVDEDGGIKIQKAAVYYSWNLPALAGRLDMTEDELRKAIYKHTQNDKILDESIKCFLPPVGGLTVYIFGDPRKIRDSNAEIAVRVHDECNGSDVFGTDICTCRPYLVFALQACIECAQRGGVGIVVYFRKEGRSLGEVTKYRVYNARKNQDGGDVSEKYFFQTESIAGIRDARFQTMMPDVLNWLGLTRIDWLLSMSNEKYEAITGAGIEVLQRVALPEMFVPKQAFVEMNAKIASGYHADGPLKSKEIIEELQHLTTIRKQCNRLYERAKKDQLRYFKFNSDKLESCAQKVVETIDNWYPDLKIPYHSRLRHFGERRLKLLDQRWKYVDAKEKARRMIDLVTVSVLLDAGAGPDWKYVSTDGNTYNRSEGLAIATYDMFLNGLFSSDPAVPTRVNSLGLNTVTVTDLERGFQIGDTNKMVGLKGRCKLLFRLSKALASKREYFGGEVHRPGHIVDYIIAHAKGQTVHVNDLWDCMMGFESIWPAHISGVRRGDAWVHSDLKLIGKPGSDLVPFHKLSQWLALSMLEPVEGLGYKWVGTELFTALAEYRNGGLLVDSGVLTLKNPEYRNRPNDVGSELIVEWRALTVAVMDDVAELVRKHYGRNKDTMPLMSILEGGTWRAGRVIAKKLRANGSPPIKVRSDGTVF